MNKLPISLGILSWKSKKTLVNTLESYRKNGLFDIVSDTTILFQEGSLDDIQIAHEYKLNYMITDTNVGIGKAFIDLADRARTMYFMPLEHDWELIENSTITRHRLEAGLKLMDDGFSSIRYRHRKNYGDPLYSRPVYEGRELDHYCPVCDKMSPHLMDSIHWLNHPEWSFPDKIQKNGEFFESTSRWSCWTNNPCLFNKHFYINKVACFLDSSDLLLEPAMSKWWSNQTYCVAYGEGLFRHNDPDKYPTI